MNLILAFFEVMPTRSDQSCTLSNLSTYSKELNILRASIIDVGNLQDFLAKLGFRFGIRLFLNANFIMQAEPWEMYP